MISSYMQAEAYFTRQSHSSTQDSLEELKSSISGTKEDLEDQLDQVRQNINTAETSLRGILQVDQARLQGSLDSLVQAHRIADDIHPKVVIEHNRAGQGSRAIFGTDTSQPQFSLTVSDNEAQRNAVMGAGVHTPQTLQTLLGDSRTADLARAVQAQNTDANALQSIVNNLSAERSQRLRDTSPESNLPLSLMNSEHTNTARALQLSPQSVALMHEDATNYHEVLERRLD